MILILRHKRLNSHRKFEEVFLKLVDWAHQAIEKSCNQSVRPHAIIVLNKAKPRRNANVDQWDFTEAQLESVQKALERKTELKNKVKFWTGRKVKIETARDLLECYYTDVKVIRIPVLHDPELLEKQITKLYVTIKANCSESQKQRRRCHMRLDAVKLHLYLRNAFDHFATHADKPFDFVKASFDINPISSSFSLRDGILKLAVTVQQLTEDHMGLSVWMKISRVIASCFMLNAYQRSVKGLGKIQYRFAMHLLMSCPRRPRLGVRPILGTLLKGPQRFL
jgi:hypothetical protein